MRRVLLVLAVAVALVVGHGASSPSVALAADPIDVLDAVIVEDFEWGEDGVNLSSAATYDAPLPWQTTTPGTTTIKIKEDGAYEGDQFVRMTRPTTSQTPWLFFDWIVSDNTFGVSMAVRHDASTSNTIMLGGPYGSQYCITILARPTGVLETMNHASQYVDSGGRLSSNTWGLITIKAPDFTNGTFRLWLDETYLGQFEMFGSSDYNEVFRISSTTNAVGVTDYDYIIVQPVVLTGPVIALEGTFGTLSAYASTAAWDDITDVGFVWDTSPIAFPPLGTPPSDFEPEGNGGWWEGGDEGWEADDWFFHFIYSLDAETEYYYRAAVKVGSQWIYGKQESFETGEAPPPELSPTVRTDNATNITHEGAKLNGYIESPGSDEKCDYYGFVWGKTSQSDPGDTAPGDTDYASYWTAVPALATGPISRVITVDPDTVYYFRACAHNSGGWTYGAEFWFDSLSPDEGEPPIPVPPVTMDVSGISNGILLAVLTALLMFASVAGDWKRFWPLIIIASIGWFFTAGWAMYLSLTAHDGYWVAAIICVGMALATIMWPLIVKGPATAIEQVSDEDDAWGGKRKKRYPRRLDID